MLMDSLFRKHDRLLANTSMDIIRDKMNEIHWNAQLVSIIGAKGVGKSTLIKQHLKQNFKLGDRRVLYCSADTVDFSTRTLVGLAEEFVIHGGELLVIDEIHKYGKKAGIAIKPGTPIEAVFPYLEKVEMVLVMTVEPGFGGQKLIPETLDKVRMLRKLIDERKLDVDIQVDGGVYIDNVEEILEAGANVIVSGSGIFKGDISENIIKFRNKLSE